MSGSRTRRQAVILLLVPAAAAAGLAACSSTASSTAQTSPAATTRALTSRFSPAQLRGALLSRVNGVAAKTPATSGDYSSFTGASSGKSAPAVGRVTPQACAGTPPTGLSTAALAGALAASVSFKVASDDVSEVLVALPDTAASSALGGQFAAKCAHYTQTTGGKTVRYTVRETPVTGIGKQATALSVRSSGSAADNRWSLSYRGAGFAGSVTVVGPNASELAVEQLGRQAYAYAAKSLG